MSYALNLDVDGRILSATFSKYAPPGAVIVQDLPEGDLHQYRYVSSVYIYDPLPEPAPIEPAVEGSVWDELDAAYLEGVNSV